MRWAPNVFSWVMVHRGQIAEALEQCERETALISPDSDISSIWAYGQMASAYIYARQYEEAEEAFGQIIPSLTRTPAAMHLGVDLFGDAVTTVAALWLNAADADKPRYAQMLKDAEGWQARFARWFSYSKPRRANLQAYIARLRGDNTAAERHARAALPLADQYKMPLDSALAYHTLARVASSDSVRADYAALCVQKCAELGILPEYLYPN